MIFDTLNKSFIFNTNNSSHPFLYIVVFTEGKELQYSKQLHSSVCLKLIQ